MSYVLGTVVDSEAQRIDDAARAAAGPMPTTPPAKGMRWALVMEQRYGGKGTGVTGPYTWQQIGGREVALSLSMPPPPATGAEPPGAPADPIVEQKEREAAAYCKGRKTGLLIAAGVWVALRALR